MGNASQTGASFSKITKASSLKDSPIERPPGDNSLKSHVEYEEKSSLKKKTKKRNKLKKKHDALILGSQDENCLRKDLETPQNNPALGRKQRKNQKEKLNASENFNIHNDHEVGSVLVENPPLKSYVDVNSVQNNTILGAKKKKKRKKKKKHNALEDSNIHNELDNGSSLVENPPLLEINSSLQPPLNCLKMDTEMVDNSLKSDVEYEAKSCLKKEKKKRNKLKRKHDASILEAQVDYCLPKDLETAKQRKKRKNQKEKPSASENCNIDNDHEEDSVLAENPSLKSDVGVESVQNNLTLGVKKKKKRKKKNKKHNALEDGSAHNDLEEGSLLVENLATLKRDVDMKTAQISQDMPDQSGTVKSLGDTAELVLSSALNTTCQQSLTNLSGHVLKNADRLPQKVDGCSTSDSSFDQTSTTFPDKLPVSETRSEHLPVGNPLQPFAGPNLIREDFLQVPIFRKMSTHK